MHPVFIASLLGSAVWFFAVTAMARRGVGAQVGFAVLGVVEFLVVSVVLGQVMKNQDFFRQALRSGPDIGPITTYIVLPTAIIVFLSGLWLRKILQRPGKAAGGS